MKRLLSILVTLMILIGACVAIKNESPLAVWLLSTAAAGTFAICYIDTRRGVRPRSWYDW